MAAGNEEVAKLKEQLARAMRGYQLLKQQADKQATELQTAQQGRDASDKKAAELAQQNASLQQEVAQLSTANSEQDGGGYDADLAEELELANARLSESTMQLQSIQQELAQQQQQAADKISSLNKKLEASEHKIKAEVDTALKQERETYDAAQGAYSKAERELTVLRSKLAELEDSTMVKTQEAMSAVTQIEELEERLKQTKHGSDLAKGELAIKLTDIDKMKSSLVELKDTKLALEESLNVTEQKLTFVTQERDQMETTISQLKEFGSNVTGQVEEFEEREKELNIAHKQRVDELILQLTDAQKASSAAMQERDQVAAESSEKEAVFEDQATRFADLENSNKMLEVEVDGFDAKAIEQEAQHKLNEKKNLKMIRELKAQLVKQMEVSSKLEEEAAEQSIRTDESHANLSNRSRSHTVDTPGSSGGVALAVDDVSLSDLNFSLGTQLEEAKAEIQRKEEMLQHYLRNLDTKGLTSMESDVVASQHEDVKCSSGGLWGMFVGVKDTVDGEVHRKLKEVLEETLLENIRLKNDVDAMGSEVARLASEADKR